MTMMMQTTAMISVADIAAAGSRFFFLTSGFHLDFTRCTLINVELAFWLPLPALSAQGRFA
jgi:hypothetical protein